MIHPDRIVNKTNGISFRRWLYQANPGLTKLIVEAIGPEVEDDADAARSRSWRSPTTRRSASGSPPCAA